MNKQELAVAVANECELTKKDAELAVAAVFDQIARALEEGDTVKISGFGVFAVKTRQARNGTVPGTSQKIEIPETKTVGFKPSKSLKEAVN